MCPEIVLHFATQNRLENKKKTEQLYNEAMKRAEKNARRMLRHCIYIIMAIDDDHNEWKECQSFASFETERVREREKLSHGIVFL